MIHQNIRSAPRNLKNFECFLSNLNHTFPFIGCSETWFKDHNVNLYGIKGYTAEHNYRKKQSGGGVSIYVKDNIEYTLRKDLTVMNTTLETIFIEVKKDQIGNKKDMIIGVIYRPPGTDIRSSSDELIKILNKIKIDKKTLYLLGDYNANLINIDKHTPTQELLDMLYSYLLLPLVTKPTRVTTTTATLIDNIFTNDLENLDKAFTGILYSDVTDHFPIFYIDNTQTGKTAPKFILKRLYTPANSKKFSEQLNNQDWSEILNSQNVKEANAKYLKIYKEAYEACFPVKRVKLGYNNKKPWLKQNILEAIKIKNKMHKNLLDTGDPYLGILYRRFRNRVNKMVMHAERDHYRDLIAENKDNMKKTWQILKEIINKNKKTSISSRFMVNNQIIINKQDIADGFNSFYVNVGPTLAKKIPKVNKSPSSFIKKSYNHKMFVKEVTQEEVRKIITELKNGSSGWDQISAKIFKSTVDAYLIPFTHICNLSIISGIFPDEMKLARVIPLYKTDDPLLFSNYRPVSVLPVMSKVLERLMYNRLLNYLNKYKILYDFQFGFRNKHSPNLALIYLIDKISTALEKGEYVLGLFLDFSKAFDTVDHAILFEKLEYYGVNDISLNWFKSYLNNRYQYVEYNGTKSSQMKITCGVPQGSILGPLLFLIYINDLADASTKLFALMFADDSNMFISGTNINELINTMNEEMIKIVEWLRVNKLSLNLKKTHFIIFRRNRSKTTNENSNNNNNNNLPNKEKINNLVIDNVIIERKTKTKFLGVILDELLSFEHHTKHVKSKVARGVGILYKGRKSLDKTSLTQLYNSFICPYLNYCLTVWGNTFQANIEPLEKIQRRAVRVISGLNRQDDVSQTFLNLNILTFKQLYAYNIQILMYKYYHGDLPHIFEQFFTLNNQIHQYDTKSKHNFHVAFGKTHQMATSIRIVGVRSFNHFKKNIEIKNKISTYKKHLKRVIITEGINYLYIVT